MSLFICKKQLEASRAQTNRVCVTRVCESHLPDIRRFVDGCAALIWTLVDVWQLLPDNENSNYVTMS